MSNAVRFLVQGRKAQVEALQFGNGLDLFAVQRMNNDRRIVRFLQILPDIVGDNVERFAAQWETGLKQQPIDFP